MEVRGQVVLFPRGGGEVAGGGGEHAGGGGEYAGGGGAPGTVSPDPPTDEAQGCRGRPERFLVVLLPAFRLERCGYSAEERAALAGELKSAVRLVALTPAAAAEGLHIGMTATEARALVPDLALEPWDESGEQDDRVGLILAFRRLSDRVDPLGPQELMLEISRTASVFGGEAGLVEEARALAEELGHRCRLAIADDPLAASALAAWGAASEVVVPQGSGAAALAELPIAALQPSADLSDALRTLGIERIGQWASLDPASVVGRFGEEGARLHRVARGGRAFDEPAQPTVALRQRVAESDRVVEEVRLGGPCTTLEPLLFVLPGLLARVGAALDRRDRLAVRLALRLVQERAGTRTVRIRVGRPTRNPRTLERVLRARLEGLRVEAPITEIVLVIEESCPTRGWQAGLLERSEAAEDLADLVARLGDVLGEEAVFSPRPVASWCPERAWLPADFAPTDAPRPEAAPIRTDRGKVDPVVAQDRFEHGLPLSRPALLLPQPELVQVREEEGLPVLVRRERGWEPVGRVAGPERVLGDWWQPAAFEREYWAVEVDGVIGWLYRDPVGLAGGRWYWHGWFD